MDKLLTVKELSSFLHVHTKTIYKWKEQGKIPYVERNGLVRFEKNDIEEWLKKGTNKNNQIEKLLPKLDLSLDSYDRMLLKGRSALSKKSKRWNYGFGAVYIRKTKHGKDRWHIDYKDEEGKRVQKVVKNAQKREEAVMELQTRVAQIFANEHPNKTKVEPVKFSKFVDMYIENYAQVNKRSWKDDHYRLQKCIEFFGDVYLHEISPLEIEKFKLSKKKEEISGSTINRYLTILKRMFNIAIEWGYTKENPDCYRMGIHKRESC